jgi:AraC family transcriptional regulator
METMEQQLHTRVTLGELSRGVGISVAQLTRLFRTAIGVTPGKYLHERRIGRARVLLERASLSVPEVMAQVGLSDRRQFVRDFLSMHGYDPTTFRAHSRPPEVDCPR